MKRLNGRSPGFPSPGHVLALVLVAALFASCGDDESTKPEDTTRTLSVSSENPDEGVSVTCTISGEDTTMTTPFSLAFSSDVSVTLEAPNVAEGNAFDHWLRDGQVGPTSLTTEISMGGNHTMVAVYEDLPTVSVASSPTGIEIEVNTADFFGDSDGTTPFSRSYEAGTAIVLTAPAWHDNWQFNHWERDGSTLTSSQAASLTMSQDYTVVAVYEEIPEVPLTVSAAGGLVITVNVDPPDINGHAFHTTPFTFRYLEGTNVTITAPEDAQIDPGVYGDFIRWRTTAGIEENRELALTMDSAKNLTAVYPEVRSFFLEDLDTCEGNAVVPTRIGSGDREFGGHGPDVWANVHFTDDPGASELQVKVYFHVKETQSDWTEAEIDKIVHRESYGAGFVFQRMVTTGCSWYYRDTDNAQDGSNDHGTFSCGDPAERGAVYRFYAKGDTYGNDVGNWTCDDSYLKVFWNCNQPEEGEGPPLKFVVEPVD